MKDASDVKQGCCPHLRRSSQRSRAGAYPYLSDGGVALIDARGDGKRRKRDDLCLAQRRKREQNTSIVAFTCALLRRGFARVLLSRWSSIRELKPVRSEGRLPESDVEDRSLMGQRSVMRIYGDQEWNIQSV